MTRRRGAAAALAAAALLVPVLAVPAGAACAPIVTASAVLLQLELPTVPVPVVPPRNASASVRQTGDGRDSASGSTNALRLPVTGGAFQVASGTGQAEAQAQVSGTAGSGSASTRVEGLRVTVPASLVTPALDITASAVQARARVDSAGAPDAFAVLVNLEVNGDPLPVPSADGEYPLPGGLGTLRVGSASATVGPPQQAASQALVLELATGERLVLASATARFVGC